MTHVTTEERFRQAAESEGGMPVSAGARVAHVRIAVETGRMFYVDLSDVPEGERPGVIAEIKALVERARVRAAGETTSLPRTSVELSTEKP